MTASSTPSIDYAGVAARSDLQNGEFMRLFAQMEREQAEFLSHEVAFRSPEYPWVRDSLHNWSRVWEYPYVHHHVRRWLSAQVGNRQPCVVDLGSGVTFFPFSAARLGCHVVCADINPICQRDLERAIPVVGHSPGRVSFRLIEGNTLPFADGECDLVYCISVLEHIPDYARTVVEIGRILRPEGLCILTTDLGPGGDGFQLGVEENRRLSATLASVFEPVLPVRIVHPHDVLTTRNTPYPYRIGEAGFARLLARLLKQKIVMPMLGRAPGRVLPYFPDVAAQGLVLRKREVADS